MRATSLIEIDLAAFDRNLRHLGQAVGESCLVCPVIKADAYGHGAFRIGKRAIRAGLSTLAVYAPEEALDLIRQGLTCRYLILEPVRELGVIRELIHACDPKDLHFTGHDLEQCKGLEATCSKLGIKANIHLELDTGMHRGGCHPGEAGRLLKFIATTDNLELAGVYTHFACAESDPEATRLQMEEFESFLLANADHIGPNCVTHAANSAATLSHQRYHCSMVRIGLAWAGLGYELLNHDLIVEDRIPLKPILRWWSEIIQIKRISKGARVGYRALWTARRDSVIGIVPVGYADGYPTNLSVLDKRREGAKVGVLSDPEGGRLLGYAPVVGAVSMDQITIDLTELAGFLRDKPLRTGMAVEMVGVEPDAPNHLMSLANQAGVIPHELLCRLNPRIPRLYHDAELSVQTMETKPLSVGRLSLPRPERVARELAPSSDKHGVG